MSEEQSWRAGIDPRDALAEVDGASGAMVASTETPRGFMLTLVAVTATIVTLLNVVPWAAVLGLFSLFIPLGIWYYLLIRKRPKPRAVLSHSGPYMGYVFAALLAMQFSRFWEAHSWWEVSAKWLVLFGLFGFCMVRMRTMAIRNRLKDANERPI